MWRTVFADQSASALLLVVGFWSASRYITPQLFPQDALKIGAVVGLALGALLPLGE